MTLERIVTDYQAKTPRSRQLFEEALRVMPGGNSRTTTFFYPYPFYITRGEGPRIWDADGVERLDFNGNYTSLILGHANPAVVKAIQDAAVHGMSFPGPSEHEIRLAEILTTRIPGLEVVRFANSGTEATMHAVRVARAFTGRAKIAKFEGAYHGTHDWVLVSVAPDPAAAGSRKRPKSVAWSAGVPPMVLKHVVTLPWNDADACAKILEKQGSDIEALLIDPLLANAGMIPVREGFLEKLREVTARLGILLIFDEVISFRIGYHGAQGHFGARPDLTSLGKIIGGGFPVGAVGGRAEVMAVFDPRGGTPIVPHAGTFNANPVTMAAGLAGMRLLDAASFQKMDDLAGRLRDGLAACFKDAGVEGSVTGVGSLFKIHPSSHTLVDYRSSRPDASCSITCAVQPATRPIAKTGVNRSRFSPTASSSRAV